MAKIDRAARAKRRRSDLTNNEVDDKLISNVEELRSHPANIQLLNYKHSVRVTINGKHETKSYDIAHLAHKNSLWKPVALSIQQAAAGIARPDAYIYSARKLGQYLLQCDGSYPSLEALDTKFFTNFWQFLITSGSDSDSEAHPKAPAPKRNNLVALGHRSKVETSSPKISPTRVKSLAKRYLTVRRIFEIVRSSGGLPDDFYLPNVPHSFPFSVHKSKGKNEVISESQLMQIGVRAWEDCRRIMADYHATRAAIAHQRITHQWSPGASKWKRASSITSEITDAELLEYLDRTYPDVLPAANALSAEQHSLYRRVVAFGGMKKLKPLLYPTADTIVPFVLLLACYTAFNADVVRFIKISNIRRQKFYNESKQLADESITFIGEKPRAGIPQTATFAVNDEPHNPAGLVEFLLTWRSRALSVAEPEAVDRLFSFVAESDAYKGKRGAGKRGLRGYDYRTSNVWLNNLARWIEKHNLPKFALDDIRDAVLDMGDAMSSGDIVAVQRLAGHISANTTFQDYQSTGSVSRGEEKLAQAQNQQERYFLSEGRIDARNKPKHHDVAAATPGFHCLDPYQSPIPGERDGRLCRAYGACPACPLAKLDTESAYAYLRCLQLRDLILNAQGEISPQRWQAVWGARLEKLEIWLTQFSKKATKEAAARVMPSPLPPVE